MSSGSGNEWFPTFGVSWHVVQVPGNDAIGTVVPNSAANVALSFKPRTLGGKAMSRE
jgi:hypothetical protein